ncbi:hypothetical protein HYV49_02000 [Candidatus Pacearchaeota archaeon]|nr:hypothetical protein [Candidatus Pacearchaeota archaeon]
MADYKCEKCNNREFSTADALAMHNKAKHYGDTKQSIKPSTSLFPQNKKKIRNWIIAIVIILIIFGVYLVRKDKTSNNNNDGLNIILSNESLQKIPQGAVHWHPKLKIIIDGDEQLIPVGIGITIGKIIDTGLSGMRMSPTHTHESDGTIHLENNNPSKKPETLTLGYFFYVWDKQFSSSCIFDYCTDKGELKMYVGGEENTEFENYIMQDKDEIVIEYESRG